MIRYISEYLFGDLIKDNRFYYLSLIKESDDCYSIHGLWPQFSKKSYPTYCREVNFSLEKLKPIMKELNQYWFSTEEKNSDFWKHEYEKHGSCMFSSMTEIQYFSKTIDLYKKAIELGLPSKYENEKTNKCLIPVTLNFEFKD